MDQRDSPPVETRHHVDAESGDGTEQGQTHAVAFAEHDRRPDDGDRHAVGKRPPARIALRIVACGTGQRAMRRAERPKPRSFGSPLFALWPNSSGCGEKRAAEPFADRVPITIVRPPIVLGEPDRMGLPLFRSIARFGVHMVPGLDRRRFSLIDADDLVQLLILAAQRGKRCRLAVRPNRTDRRAITLPRAKRIPPMPSWAGWWPRRWDGTLSW